MEYGRDVLGDSFDWEESDQEGWVLRGGTTGTVSNGIWSVVVTGNSDGVEFIPLTNLAYKVYHTMEWEVKSVTITSLRVDVYLDNVFQESNTKTITTSYTTITHTFTTNFDSVRLWEQSGETGTFELREARVIGDLDYATHAEGAVEDTWDWEDSTEYGYDVFGNVIDFDDGTIENFGLNCGVGSVCGALSNVNTSYLKIPVTGSASWVGFLTPIYSITASTYKFLTMEFYYSSASTITSIGGRDVDGNWIFSDSTGWSANTWHLFTIDLSLDPDWTGTETRIYSYFNNTWTNGDILYLNMVYLYDTSLGDLDGFTSTNLAYNYVDPTGYLTSGLMTAGVTNRYIRTASLAPDITVFDTAIIRIKGSEAGLLFRLGNSAVSVAYTEQQTLTTSFQTFVLDFSADPDWTTGATILSLIVYDVSNGVFEGDERIWVDYILLLASTEQQQDFTMGFYDQDNSQADLLNVTHHFWNSTAFRWEIELYDSNQEIASYYYSANQTLEDAGYEAVDTTLSVDGFSATSSQWTTSGASPWLNAVDGSYIEAYNDSLIQRWFTFADTSADHTTDYETDLELYLLTGDGDDDIEWRIDLNGDNTAEYLGTLSNPTSGWYTIGLTGITTKADINSARLSLTKKVSGINSSLQIDSARLAITHDSTISESSCFNAYCRARITYNFLESEFAFEVRSDSGTRIFKKDWTTDFTTTGNPTIFAFAKVPNLYFATKVSFYGSLEIWLDFIRTAFKEQEWVQTTNPTDSNFISDSHIFAQAIPSIGISSNPNSIYQITVPYLDSVSGTMYHDLTNYTLVVLDRVYTYFRIYTIDWDTGTRNELIEIEMISENGRYVYIDGFDNFKFYPHTVESSSFEFSIALSNDRSKLDLVGKFLPDVNTSNVFTKMVAEKNVSDISTKASQEFVLEKEYVIDRLNGSPGAVKLSIETAFNKRDLFSDPIGTIFGGAADTIGNVVTGILQGLVSLITGFFLPMILWIGGLINTGATFLLNGLTPLFDTLLVGLQTITDILGPIIVALGEAIIDALSPLLEAIIDAIAAFWDIIVDGVEELLLALGNVLATLWDEVILPLILLGLGILDTIFQFLIDATQIIIDAIISWALDILGLTDLYNEASSLFLFLVAIIFYVYVFIVFACFSGPLIISRDPEDVLTNYWNVWSFDMTFGMSFLGIRVYIPLVLIMIVWTIILGYQTILFAVVPW